MTTRQPGRPRAAKSRIPGGSTEADLLDAAAELFTSTGFSATTTRNLTEAAGVRQATMYHHFPNKKAILLRLLIDTVEPSVALARRLTEDDSWRSDPAATLHSLAQADALLLLTAPWNIASLYGIPEIQGEFFAPFRELRSDLIEHYDALADAVLTDSTDGQPDAVRHWRKRLPFSVVETVVHSRAEQPTRRSGPDDAEPLARMIADAALNCLR